MATDSEPAFEHVWLRRLGLVVPSWNTVSEYEFWRLAPEGVSVHTARAFHTEDSQSAFDAMVESAPSVIETLVHAEVDAVCYACTGGSFYRGLDFDEQFSQRLAEAAQRPVITMAGAIVAGARALGMERVAVGAPYEDWLMQRLASYLDSAGFDVLRHHGLGVQANVKHGPEDAIALAEAAWHPDADGIIISCSNFPSLEVIEIIEERFGVPVVTSNQVSVWALLGIVGLPQEVPHAGRLLKGDITLSPGELPGAEISLNTAVSTANGRNN